MCEICHQYFCPAGCPNAKETPFATCIYCNENIVIGENYYEFDGERYHEDCFREAAEGLLISLGAVLKEANENDLDDGSDDAYERYVDEQLLS